MEGLGSTAEGVLKLRVRTQPGARFSNCLALEIQGIEIQGGGTLFHRLFSQDKMCLNTTVLGFLGLRA